MKKIKLHHNELELIGQTRKDGILYNLYYHTLDQDDHLDSGLDYYSFIRNDEIIVNNDTLSSTFNLIIESFDWQGYVESHQIYSEFFSDNYNSTIFHHYHSDLPFVLIDFINLEWASILIFMEESEGEDENIIEPKNRNMVECFQNFMDFRVFKLIDA